MKSLKPRPPIQAGDYGRDDLPETEKTAPEEKSGGETDGRKVLSLWSH